MIVHTLKMCTGDAGPGQSLVLFRNQTIEVLKAYENVHQEQWQISFRQSWRKVTRNLKCNFTCC